MRIYFIFVCLWTLVFGGTLINYTSPGKFFWVCSVVLTAPLVHLFIFFPYNMIYLYDLLIY
jgi:hypothetical protein